MNEERFHQSLSKLKNTQVSSVESLGRQATGSAPVELRFSNGTKLKSEYWRVKRPGGTRIDIRSENDPVSSFNGRIDAPAGLRKQIQEKTVLQVEMDKETGDLIFMFPDNVEFRAFNFGGESEAWEFNFSDGTFEFASYVFE